VDKRRPYDGGTLRLEETAKLRALQTGHALSAGNDLNALAIDGHRQDLAASRRHGCFDMIPRVGLDQ